VFFIVASLSWAQGFYFDAGLGGGLFIDDLKHDFPGLFFEKIPNAADKAKAKMDYSAGMYPLLDFGLKAGYGPFGTRKSIFKNMIELEDGKGKTKDMGVFFRG
jgi:hypothetical protein